MDPVWSNEKMQLAQKIVAERFKTNSVARHLAPHSMIDEGETTVKRNRYDFAEAIVIDREVLSLYEPFSFCRFSKAQVDEFAKAIWKDEDVRLTRVATTLTRAASNLARWHDVLFFRGLRADLKPHSVQMPPLGGETPQSLREAAIQADDKGPIQVGGGGGTPNEALVTAVYNAVLRLEDRGYYNTYHLVLGETLWQELHRPTRGSMVLPRDRIEPTLSGGTFYRTTTLPKDEALLVSLDGLTFDCVVAGDPAQHPRFEWLRVTGKDDEEQFYLFRVRERFTPRIRENKAITRLVTPEQSQA
jgi:hypothetical protein